MTTSFGQTVADQTPRTTPNFDDIIFDSAIPNNDGQYVDFKVTQQDFTKLRIVTKTGNYTIQANDDMVRADASGGAITITLPTAAGITGVKKIIKRLNSGGNAVTIACNGSETIDGASTKTLSSQYDKIIVISNGTTWDIIG